jgi:hypothetical protein
LFEKERGGQNKSGRINHTRMWIKKKNVEGIE